jgi:hypothetical protein
MEFVISGKGLAGEDDRSVGAAVAIMTAVNNSKRGRETSQIR